MTPSAQALWPVAARYAQWLRLSEQEIVADRDEPGDDIRAMQLVLRLERDAREAPSRHAALALAASGAAMLCLDPRSEPGGEWYEAVVGYCRGHIRKVARRARAGAWDAVAGLPGVSREDGPTQLRLLVPGPVAQLDKRIAKLQVGGTDLPWDPPTAAPDGPLLQVWVPDEPPMTAGKQLAQTGHAGMIAAALLADADRRLLRDWAAGGCSSHVRRADPATWSRLLGTLADPERAWRQEGLLAVRDAGFTEIPAGTVTVIARAPR